MEKKQHQYRKSELTHSYFSQYSKNNKSEINNLCDTYGTDKGETKDTGHPYAWPSHNYADFYDLMFGLRRSDVDLVIECGLGTNNKDLASSMGSQGKPGASLRLWRDYFPKARIIGVDIDQEILFSEERIETFFCDQTNPDSIRAFAEKAKLNHDSVDIIIDDGLHTFNAGRVFFEEMIPYLAQEGLYVIEDVKYSDFLLYKDYFLQLQKIYAVQFVSLYTPHRYGGDDNRLIVIKKVKQEIC